MDEVLRSLKRGTVEVISDEELVGKLRAYLCHSALGVAFKAAPVAVTITSSLDRSEQPARNYACGIEANLRFLPQPASTRTVSFSAGA